MDEFNKELSDLISKYLDQTSLNEDDIWNGIVKALLDLDDRTNSLGDYK